MARNPNSDEARAAGRTFFFVKSMDLLQDCIDRSPLPFTPDQRDQLIALLAGV